MKVGETSDGGRVGGIERGSRAAVLARGDVAMLRAGEEERAGGQGQAAAAGGREEGGEIVVEVSRKVARVGQTVGVGPVPEEGVADPVGVAAGATGVPVQDGTVGLESVDVGVGRAGDDEAQIGDDLRNRVRVERLGHTAAQALETGTSAGETTVLRPADEGGHAVLDEGKARRNGRTERVGAFADILGDDGPILVFTVHGAGGEEFAHQPGCLRCRAKECFDDDRPFRIERKTKGESVENVIKDHIRLFGRIELSDNGTETRLGRPLRSTDSGPHVQEQAGGVPQIPGDIEVLDAVGGVLEIIPDRLSAFRIVVELRTVRRRILGFESIEAFGELGILGRTGGRVGFPPVQEVVREVELVETRGVDKGPVGTFRGSGGRGCLGGRLGWG